MAGDWREIDLISVSVFLNRGGAPAYVDNGGILVVNQKCIRDHRVDYSSARRTDPARKAIGPEREVRPWDILVNSTGIGTLGRVAQVTYLPERATVDSHVTIVRPDREKIEPRFLGYVLRHNEAAIEALGDGSTGQKELSRARLSSLSLLIPSRSEQRAIAHILGTLDDKIEVNRRMSATLEAMARALFKSWFVDFEPVRAKAEGRDPGLPPHLAALFPDRLVESRRGLVPAGWMVEPLGEHVEVAKGVSYHGEGLGSAGVPLHNLNSIYEGGGYKYDGIKYYTGDYRARHVVRPGDVIVANTEQGHDRLLIGYAAIVPKVFGEFGIASHHIFRVSPKPSSSIKPAFLCAMLNERRMHDVVSGYANGTTVNMLPESGLQIPHIVIPPADVISAFEALASRAELRREEMISGSRTLAALRDTLLPKLISGELRVQDAERFVATAT